MLILILLLLFVPREKIVLSIDPKFNIGKFNNVYFSVKYDVKGDRYSDIRDAIKLELIAFGKFPENISRKPINQEEDFLIVKCNYRNGACFPRPLRHWLFGQFETKCIKWIEIKFIDGKTEKVLGEIYFWRPYRKRIWAESALEKMFNQLRKKWGMKPINYEKEKYRLSSLYSEMFEQRYGKPGK